MKNVFLFLILFVVVIAFPSSIFAQSVANTKFGMYYLLWHCPTVNHAYGIPDVSEILAGNQGWWPIPSFHFWGKPALGYYCLSQNETVLRQHANLIRNLGIDFIFVDATNHIYTNPSKSNNPQEQIMNPFDQLLRVWNTIPDAPKIVIWVPVTNDGDMVNYLTDKLKQYPNLQFLYQNKPLLLVTDNGLGGQWIVDEGRITQLSSNYSVRKMWGLYRDTIPINHWSWLQHCSAGFKESGGAQVCNQFLAKMNGSPEQLAVGTAYQDTYASLFSTAVPKFDGKTLQKQFQTMFNYPGIPIVTITGWNEFVAQRFCLDTTGNATHLNCTEQNDHWPDGNKIFVDSYNKDYNRDIEPAENDRSDNYYKITKACINLYKSGGHCDNSNTSNLCCTVPTYIHGYVEQYQCNNPNWNIAGWATDDRNHTRKLTVRAEIYPDNEPFNKVSFTGVANGLRSDLITSACSPDGTCAYGIKINSLPLSFKDKKLRVHVFGVAFDSEMELNMRKVPNNIFGPCNNLIPSTPTTAPTSTPVKIVGDYDGNGVVNLADFGIWKGKYLIGQMALADFGVWKREYLK